MSPKRQTHKCSQPLNTAGIANTGNNPNVHRQETRNRKCATVIKWNTMRPRKVKSKSQLHVAIWMNLTDETSEDANQAKRQRQCGLIYVKLKVRETHLR